ncbi:hypothetical protein L9F63_011584, partial [Diploptera punctata]
CAYIHNILFKKQFDAGVKHNLEVCIFLSSQKMKGNVQLHLDRRQRWEWRLQVLSCTFPHHFFITTRPNFLGASPSSTVDIETITRFLPLNDLITTDNIVCVMNDIQMKGIFTIIYM